MRTTQQTTQTGFTLIELMIAVAIVALLAAIAVPNYTQYVERTRRADATTALTRTAGQLERCYTQFGVYNHASCASYTTVNAGPLSEDEDYRLTIAAGAAGGAKQSYVLTATATAAGSQANDEKCVTFTLSHLGEKNSTPGPETSNNCW
jgi:type IV pilus assembly protein PilE